MVLCLHTWDGLRECQDGDCGRTDGGRRFCSDRTVPRRVTEKGSRIYVVCCIHGWSVLFWAYSKGGGNTKTVEYRTVSRRVEYYRENVIFGGRRSLSSERR